MMRSLLSVSLCLLLLCCSCAPSITKGRKGSMQPVATTQLPPLIDASAGLRKYNMTVDFMRKHFSGLLLVKETSADTCRVLFSTHFGLSLFDFEISRDTLLVHHCIAPLKKKKILHLLRQDFSILLGLTPPTRRLSYRQAADTGRLQEIRFGSGLGKTTFLVIPDSVRQEAAIQIRHTGFRLQIGLEEIK